MAKAPISVDDPPAYRVEVRARRKGGQQPYIWEIYQTGREAHVLQSDQSYATAKEAWEAGHAAYAQFMSTLPGLAD